MKKQLKTVSRKIQQAVSRRFSPFIVFDNCGTLQFCWTEKDALEWFPYCGESAMIVSRYARTEKRVVAFRRQFS